MQANFLVSERAQVSTSKMEALTEKMHEIAAKTQTETVSMRIITVVTLFFLPGTFISVSGQSLKRDFANYVFRHS